MIRAASLTFTFTDMTADYHPPTARKSVKPFLITIHHVSSQSVSVHVPKVIDAKEPIPERAVDAQQTKQTKGGDDEELLTLSEMSLMAKLPSSSCRLLNRLHKELYCYQTTRHSSLEVKLPLRLASIGNCAETSSIISSQVKASGIL